MSRLCASYPWLLRQSLDSSLCVYTQDTYGKYLPIVWFLYL